MTTQLKRALIVAVIVGAIIGATIALTTGDDKPAAPAPALTISVDGPDKDRKADDQIIAGPKARDVLEAAQAAPDKFDLGGGLRGKDSSPEGVIEGPLATPNWPGCQTRFVPNNFSSRRGQTIRGFGVHYTASANIAGYADMNGLTAYSSRPAAGVSWHFLIDREGHCYYNVPVNQKAWTIGNLNGQTINVEMIGRGNEPGYGGVAGLRKLGEVVRRAARIYNFPVRLGAVSNCTVTRPGIVTHWMGGSCAGGHADIKPYDIAAVTRQLAAGGAKPVTARDRATCRKLNAWRNAGSPKGGDWERNSVRRKAALTKRGVVCGRKGPVKT